ncbi:MAG: HD domain-containing protein [Fimbriimonadaceae bacterium]|nr:HD domain-containing protein [Fimbriimonadaceae bacterium]
MRAHLYRDLIHGQIRFPRVEQGPTPQDSSNAIGYLVPGLRSTPAFQRLRSIRQNGLTNFVFATMEHSRFVHSMGTYWMCNRMYDAIVRNSGLKVDERDRTLVAIAGLLHDIGHGPFSHSFEKSVEGFDHEAMSIRLLREYEPIASLLNEVDDEFLEDMIPYIDKSARTVDKWSYRIVSSQLDADRLDYMLRDSRLAGLDGHGFDLERLLDMLTIENGRIAIDDRATPTIEAYLVMRLHLHEMVYFHKGVRASQSLLVSILKRCFDLIRSGSLQHLDSLPCVASHVFQRVARAEEVPIDAYVRFGEHHCWVAFDIWATEAQDSILQDLAQRIVSRRPFKAITLLPMASEESERQQMNKAVSRVAKELNRTEDEVRRYYCSIDEPQTLAYKTFDPDGKKPEEEIWFRGRDTTIKRLSEYKDNSIFEATKIPRISQFFIFPEEGRSIAQDTFSYKEYAGQSH